MIKNLSFAGVLVLILLISIAVGYGQNESNSTGNITEPVNEPVMNETQVINETPVMNDTEDMMQDTNETEEPEEAAEEPEPEQVMPEPELVYDKEELGREMNDSLMSYYKFDDGTFNDERGLYNATLDEYSGSYDPKGIIGGSWTLCPYTACVASGDWVMLPSPGISGRGSVNLWIRPVWDNQGNALRSIYVFGRRKVTNSDYQGVFMTNNTIKYFMVQKTPEGYVTHTAIGDYNFDTSTDDKWYMLTTTWGDNGLRLYVNSEPVAEDSFSGAPEETDMVLLGKSTISSNDPYLYYGNYEELAVFGSELTDPEIDLLYSGGKAFEIPVENDKDDDGIPDETDNCPDIANPDQKDIDNDGFGDMCDVCPLDYENDVDGDTFCVSDGDCNDNDALINPAALEVCGDSIDNDCNGQGDEGIITVKAVLYTLGTYKDRFGRTRISLSSRLRTTTPITDMEVRVYDRSGGSCSRVRRMPWMTYRYFWENCEEEYSCTTDENGICNIEVDDGNYLLISKYTEGGYPRYHGTSLGRISCFDEKTKKIKMINTSRGLPIISRITESLSSDDEGGKEVALFVYDMIGDWDISWELPFPGSSVVLIIT